MERESSKLRYIGIFRMTLDQMEQLVQDIEAEQTVRPMKLSGIQLYTSNSTISCDGVEELQECGAIEREINIFKLTFYEDGVDRNNGRRAIHVSGGKDSDNHIWVAGDEEGWVIGVADVLRTRMKRYEVWYSMLLRSDIMQMLHGIIICMIITCLVITIFWKLNFVAIEASDKLIADGALHSGLVFLIALVVSLPMSTWVGSRLPTRSHVVINHPPASSVSTWVRIGVIASVLGVVVALLRYW